MWEIGMKTIHVSNGIWNVTGPGFGNNETDSTKTDKALALIIQVLGADHMLDVEECTTARQGRKKLKIIYAVPSTASRMPLYKMFLAVRLNDGDDAPVVLNVLARTRTQPRQVGVENS